MNTIQGDFTRSDRRAVSCALSALMAMALVAGSFAIPLEAQAMTLDTAAENVQIVTAGSGSASLATADKSAIDKTVVKNAKAIVKNAKAKSGTASAKLKKIYAYVATATKWKGTFTSGSYLTDFYFKAKDTASASYYPATQPTNMKDYYKKYAIDAYKTKTAVCYHYAALFAVAAKQVLGSDATVKIAVGGTDVTGIWNTHHAWVEVKMEKTTYVYDPMNGYYYSTSVAKKKGEFGSFCGAKKTSSVKKHYKNYAGAKYCTVKL